MEIAIIGAGHKTIATSLAETIKSQGHTIIIDMELEKMKQGIVKRNMRAVTLSAMAMMMFNGFMGHKIGASHSPFLGHSKTRSKKFLPNYKGSYGPRQGNKEKARRLRQIASGFLRIGKGGLLHVN